DAIFLLGSPIDLNVFENFALKGSPNPIVPLTAHHCVLSWSAIQKFTSKSIKGRHSAGRRSEAHPVYFLCAEVVSGFWIKLELHLTQRADLGVIGKLIKFATIH